MPTAFCLLLLLTSCTAQTQSESSESSQISELQTENTPISESSGKPEAHRKEQLLVTAGNQQFQGELYQNEATEALLDKLPLTITMEDLNGNEKYWHFLEDLPADEEAVNEITAGDIHLFQSDCLVVFYQDFPTSYRYTKLGKIKDPAGLAEALGQGAVTVTFALSPEN